MVQPQREQDRIGTGLVSVVIPVYNGEKYLAHTLDSVLAQTWPQIEIMTVDDGSTDGSAEVLERYRDQVRVVRQANAGVSAARNAGIREARGEFVAFLDQDDWWLPEKLQRQVELFTADPGIGLVHTKATFFDDTKSETIDSFNNCDGTELVGDCHDLLFQGNGIVSCSVIVRRSILQQVGVFAAEICGNTVQDYDLWLRCASACRFGYVNEPLSVYRIHPSQGTWNVRRCYSELIEMLQRHAASNGSLQTAAVNRRLSELHHLLGIELLDANEHQAARQCFLEAVKLSPDVRSGAFYAASCIPPRMLAYMRRFRSQVRRYVQGDVKSTLPAWTGRVNNGV